MEIIVYRIVTMLNFILLTGDRYFCCVTVNLSKLPSSFSSWIETGKKSETPEN